MNFRPKRREEPELNLTPLIDIVFLLLIFFMVSTTFQRETEVTVELPEAGGEALLVQEKVVEITIDAKGRYYVNQQELINTRIDTLQSALRNAAGDQVSPQVILSADRATPHEAVVRAMDAAGRLGFSNLTIATVRPAEEHE